MDDERLAKIEQERQNALTQSNNAYEQMLQNNQNMYDQNKNMANTYETTQNDILDKQLAYNTNLINQQKEIAQKNKETEERKALNDYTAFNNPYGERAESLARQGLQNAGVSATERISSNLVYQNRLSKANEVLQNAITQYDNEMAQARLNNDVQKAQNALNKLQMQTDFAKEYYNNQNSYIQNRLTTNQDLDNNYFNRYQTEYSNIQNEKAREEAIRQYNQNFAYQQEQDALAQQNWLTQLAYQKERDAIADSQWEKEYALSKSTANARYGSGSSSASLSNGSSLTSGNSSNSNQTDALGNNSTTMNKSDYYWKNSDGSYTDQPSYINNTRLSSSGVTAGDIGVTGNGIGSGYRIWTANGKYYVWNNNQKTYYDVTDEYKQATKLTLDDIRANIKANNGVYKK